MRDVDVSGLHPVEVRDSKGNLDTAAVEIRYRRVHVLPTIGKDDFRFTATAGNAIGRYSDGFFPDGENASGYLAVSTAAVAGADQALSLFAVERILS